VISAHVDQFWTDLRRLRLDLGAAGEDGWSVALRTTASGQGPAAAAALRDTLIELGHSEACRRLDLGPRLDSLISMLGDG
jgi:hypothetical protein